jgi:general secretion pathway protein G
MQTGDPSLPCKPGAMKALRRLAGFTLIELLVVMAVLAILASMVAPRYLSRVDDARER